MKKIKEMLNMILLCIIGVIAGNAVRKYNNKKDDKKDAKAIENIKKRIQSESIDTSVAGLNDDMS